MFASDVGKRLSSFISSYIWSSIIAFNYVYTFMDSLTDSLAALFYRLERSVLENPSIVSYLIKMHILSYRVASKSALRIVILVPLSGRKI